VGDVPAEVEFAEQDTSKMSLRAVETRAVGDIHDQLEKLRTIAATPTPPKAAAVPPPRGPGEAPREHAGPGVGRPPGGEAQGRAGDPREAVEGRVGREGPLVFDGEGAEDYTVEAVNVRLVGNRRLERLLLRLDLEVKGKS
jgi:hypothetical protein